MSVPCPTGPLVLRGAQRITTAVTSSLRAMDRDRRGALGAALAMLLVLLAPWYELTVTAPGADGHRRALRQALSGWQALSPAAVVCAVVAVGCGAWLLGRSGTAVEGLGASARQAIRARRDGLVVAGAGTLAGLVCLIGLASHPGPHVALPGASGAAHVRFGLVLGLLVAIALAALGGRIALAASESPTGRSGLRDLLSGRRRGRSATGGDSRPADEMPQFDFPVDRRPGTGAGDRSARRVTRRTRRPTPPRTPS